MIGTLKTTRQNWPSIGGFWKNIKAKWFYLKPLDFYHRRNAPAGRPRPPGPLAQSSVSDDHLLSPLIFGIPPQRGPAP